MNKIRFIVLTVVMVLMISMTACIFAGCGDQKKEDAEPTTEVVDATEAPVEETEAPAEEPAEATEEPVAEPTEEVAA